MFYPLPSRKRSTHRCRSAGPRCSPEKSLGSSHVSAKPRRKPTAPSSAIRRTIIGSKFTVGIVTTSCVPTIAALLVRQGSPPPQTCIVLICCGGFAPMFSPFTPMMVPAVSRRTITAFLWGCSWSDFRLCWTWAAERRLWMLAAMARAHCSVSASSSALPFAVGAEFGGLSISAK